MSKKLTTEEIVQKFKETHGDKYDYSKVEYKNALEKVCIICPEHGEFWQNPYKHINGQGCKLCSRPIRDAESFIKKAKEIHGNKYDYSKVEYKTTHTKVCIICPEHGEFWQTPANHMFKKGCPKCVGKNKTTEEVIQQFKEIHGDKYNYSKVEYVNCDTKVCIICPEHGEFWQTPNSHLTGCGCPKCAHFVTDTESFIKKAREIHGEKYDYSKVEYVNYFHKKVCIICPEHGEFWQKPYIHIDKSGCPECGKEKTYQKRVMPLTDYIARAHEVHGYKYDYSKVSYQNMKEKICIICPEHGEFWQEAFSHLTGCGCPKCAHFLSKGEMYIKAFLETLGLNVYERKRDIIPPYEIDIFLPQYNLGIEFDGLIWHSSKFVTDNNYHLAKTQSCKNKGIGLIHIFEDEYRFKKEIVLNKLKHIIGLSNNSPKIYGRKCNIKMITYHEAYEFLEKNHIQGGVNATIYLGAFFENNLIGVMSFKRINKKNEWELTRFATDNMYVCCGVGGKIFKFFINEYNPDLIKTFADRRWTINEENNLYTQLGFEFVGYTKPNYQYIINCGYKRVHKFNLRKKQLLSKYGDKFELNEQMTEKEMVDKIGIYRIYDCGLLKYIWKCQK